MAEQVRLVWVLMQVRVLGRRVQRSTSGEVEILGLPVLGTVQVEVKVQLQVPAEAR